MSEIPSGHHHPRQRGQLRLVETSFTPEKHESEHGLVFFDINDASLSEIEVAERVKSLTDKGSLAELLRERDINDHPKVIARVILQKLNILPDLDELRERANQKATTEKPELQLAGSPEGIMPGEEMKAMLRAAEIEKLLRTAVAYNDTFEKHEGSTETDPESTVTIKADFITELEKHMNERDYYKTNVLRVTTAMMRHTDMGKYRPSLILSSRYIKTMLLLNEEDATVTPLR